MLDLDWILSISIVSFLFLFCCVGLGVVGLFTTKYVTEVVG